MNRRHPRVLIVEDDANVVHAYTKIFEWWHWEVVGAGTVAQGLALLGWPLDLVLLDLMLPDGSGIEILRAARGRGLAVPIAVWTGRDLADLDEVLALKPDYVFLKPFVIDPLKALAHRIYVAFVPAF